MMVSVAGLMFLPALAFFGPVAVPVLAVGGVLAFF
jgi:hypothetical protein